MAKDSVRGEREDRNHQSRGLEPDGIGNRAGAERAHRAANIAPEAIDAERARSHRWMPHGISPRSVSQSCKHPAKLAYDFIHLILSRVAPEAEPDRAHADFRCHVH